ncbi:hypothetical protein ACIBCT_20915 [Streptosporangium sp. NPDC050855]|uniref:hypothetical protein n=1 Tax=Streptosporangium sp. NPDC050855 TaxID=3366194 RepID=UPI00379E94A0
MSRSPIGELAKFAALLAQPEMERRSYWWPVVGFKHWALILITHGKPGELPEKPMSAPAPRMSPEWLRRTGEDLGPEDLMYERIASRLKAHTQGDTEVDVTRAASIAVDAVLDMVRSDEIDLFALASKQDGEAL